MMKELIERLRNYQAYCPNTDSSNHPICKEAADALEILEMEKRRLFAVTRWEDYEGGGIMYVFSSREKAEACLAVHPDGPTTTYGVEEIEVDEWPDMETAQDPTP